MNIGVIGAGILGLCAAHELGRRGHNVVVFERDEPFTGASGRSFAWLNANRKRPWTYYDLNRRGIEAHAELAAEFSEYGEWFKKSGSILIDFSEDCEQTYESRYRESISRGYPVVKINELELAQLEPRIAGNCRVSSALYFPSEAHLETDRFAAFLSRRLNEISIPVLHCDVVRVEPSRNGVRVEGESLSRRFDKVLICSGEWSDDVAQSFGTRICLANTRVPSQVTHSFLGVSEPVGDLVRRVIVSDRLNVRPMHSGRLLIQTPKMENLTSRSASLRVFVEVREAMARELLRLFGSKVSVDDIILSSRSLPQDGRSISGFLNDEGNIYGLVTHSGMTLAPLLGRLVADELEGTAQPLLEDFRPQRFRDGVEELQTEDFIGKQ